MSAGNKQPGAENNDDRSVKAADCEQPAAPQTNFKRLISHLPKDSLAVKLVAAYAASGKATSVEAVAKLAADHLEELKRSYDKSENQQD